MKRSIFYIVMVFFLSVFSNCQSDQKPSQATGQDSGRNTIDGTKSQNQDADSAIAPGRPPEDK